MSGLEELVHHYYFDENYNCAETIIHAANDYYHLDVKQEDMKLFGGFGGGMFSGLVCGALVADVAVISRMIVQRSAKEEKGSVRPKIQETVRTFRNHLEGLSCAELKPKYHTKEEGCYRTILLGAQALEMTVNKLKENE
ncbi:MAG: C-GCAxxG-C-C family protein [Erysipelotrichaceae bacterium]|nr:C-GCAxxG-C-C family protein [Erysipelotrichaceae bacterium]